MTIFYEQRIRQSVCEIEIFVRNKYIYQIDDKM